MALVLGQQDRHPDPMSANQDQADFWTNQAGPTWVAEQAAMDQFLAPVLELVLKTAALQPGHHVLDVGCGAGASTLAAHAVTGAATGVDISATLLAQARQMAPDVRFIEADAQTEDLGGPYDALISRFGVMFFEDTGAAFANIARHMAPGAPLTLAVWGPARLNPYFLRPAQIAAQMIGQPPKTDRTLPGPFAFEDADRVKRLLTPARLTDLNITETPVFLTPPGGPDDFAQLCTRIGSAQSILRQFEASPEQTEQLKTALSEGFTDWMTPQGLRVPATLNLITGRFA